MSEETSIIQFTEDPANQEQPEPLPAGKYEGEIREATANVSSKGTRYAAVSFFVSPDQYPADFTEGNPDGMTLVYRRVPLEDNPMSRYQLKKFLKAIQAPGGREIDLNEWVGLRAQLEVTHETYEGETRANVKSVAKID